MAFKIRLKVLGLFYLCTDVLIFISIRKKFTNIISRRQSLKTSLSGITLAAFPSFSLAQTNPDVVVIGAGSSGLAALHKVP